MTETDSAAVVDDAKRVNMPSITIPIRERRNKIKSGIPEGIPEIISPLDYPS